MNYITLLGYKKGVQPTTVGNQYTDQSFEIACVMQACQPVMLVCDPEPSHTCWRSGCAPLCHALPIPGAFSFNLEALQVLYRDSPCLR